MRHRPLVLALTAAAVLLIAALLVDSPDDSLMRLQEAGSIRIGYAVEAPFAFVTARGVVTGEAPETARLIAARLGIGGVTWRQAAFELLIGELRAGTIDVIAAGMFITPERAGQIRFSRPTVQATSGLLVPAGNPRMIRTYRDLLAAADLRVAVLHGSVEEAALLDAGFVPGRLVRVLDVATGRAALDSGEADTLALSAPTLRWMLRERPDDRFELVELPENPGHARSGWAAFGFRPEDRALADAWDRELATWLGSSEHRAILSRFGFSATELPEHSAP